MVKSVCIFNEKQINPEFKIQDFSQFDMSNVETIKLPKFFPKPEQDLFERPMETWLRFSSNEKEKRIYLDCCSIDTDAFVDFPNLKSLHMRLLRYLKTKMDLKHLTNLNEFRLEFLNQNEDMEDDVRFNMGMDLPVNLQKLSLIDTHCKLDSLVYLNNLTHLELRDISDLEISNTRPFDCFKKLTSLTLERCAITSQGLGRERNKIWFGLESLEDLTLKLDTNEGKRTKCFLDKMLNLKRFHLVVTNINEIDLNSFENICNLEEFNIRFDHRRKGNKEMKFILDKFTKLKKLSIDKATYVHGDLFKNLINLEHLTLKHLDSRSCIISLSSFKNQTKLVYLNLIFVKLENIDEAMFETMSNLQTLILTCSEIKKISANLFKNLKELKTLKINACSLSEIDIEAFRNLCCLEELDLSYNELDDVNVKTFEHLKSLKLLKLSKGAFFLLKTLFLS